MANTIKEWTFRCTAPSHGQARRNAFDINIDSVAKNPDGTFCEVIIIHLHKAVRKSTYKKFHHTRPHRSLRIMGLLRPFGSRNDYREVIANRLAREAIPAIRDRRGRNIPRLNELPRSSGIASSPRRSRHGRVVILDLGCWILIRKKNGPSTLGAVEGPAR